MPHETGVGLVGYGLAGAVFHGPLIAATPGLRVAAVVTSDPARAARARHDHPGARVARDLDELLARPEGLGLVVVASANRAHVDQATAALEAGLPVVVDKPPAATSAEARGLVRLARDRGLMLTVFQNRRLDGDILTLRRLLAAGALGRLLRLESRFERWRPDVAAGAWRERPDPRDAGGVLADLGSHLIDQALLIAGPAVRVYAELDRRRPGALVDDDAFVAITHASGVRSHLWASMVAAAPGPRLRALGTAGAYVKHGLDVQEAALRSGARPPMAGWGEEPPEAWGHLSAGHGARAVRTLPGAWPRFYAGVVAALRGGPPPVLPEDSVGVLEVIEAARRSAALGGPILMDP